MLMYIEVTMKTRCGDLSRQTEGCKEGRTAGRTKILLDSKRRGEVKGTFKESILSFL